MKPDLVVQCTSINNFIDYTDHIAQLTDPRQGLSTTNTTSNLAFRGVCVFLLCVCVCVCVFVCVCLSVCLCVCVSFGWSKLTFPVEEIPAFHPAVATGSYTRASTWKTDFLQCRHTILVVGLNLGCLHCPNTVFACVCLCVCMCVCVSVYLYRMCVCVFVRVTD